MDAAEAFDRQVVGWGAHVLLHPLQAAEDIVVVPAEDGGARHQRHVRVGGEFGNDFVGPFKPRLAVDLLALGQQRAAEA